MASKTYLPTRQNVLLLNTKFIHFETFSCTGKYNKNDLMVVMQMAFENQNTSLNMYIKCQHFIFSQDFYQSYKH